MKSKNTWKWKGFWRKKNDSKRNKSKRKTLMRKSNKLDRLRWKKSTSTKPRRTTKIT